MDETKINNLIDARISQKLDAMNNLVVPFHFHNGWDNPQIDPKVGLLGFPVNQVSDASIAPTDVPNNGTFRYQVDTTPNYYLWSYITYDNSGSLVGAWESIELGIPLIQPGFTVNTAENLTDYFTWTTPILTSSTEFIGWDNSSVNVGGTQGGAGFTSLNFTGNSLIQANVPGGANNDNYSATDGKAIRIKHRCRVADSPSVGQIMGFGLCDPATNIYALQTDIGNSIRFVINGTSVYAVNGDSSENTNTNISASVNENSWNVYEIVFDPGVSAKFYVNGILLATHTTDLPTGELTLYAIGCSENGKVLEASPVIFSIEL